MDLRTLPEGLNAEERCEERRKKIEKELGIDLSILTPKSNVIGHAEERNCENMFGGIFVPVGHAGPLSIRFSSGENTNVHLPLATTEGALVASVNRGCKAIGLSDGVTTNSDLKGVTRSVCLKVPPNGVRSSIAFLEASFEEWKAVGEATSNHLKVLSYSIAFEEDYVFLTVAADTDEAMGMNMITIAMQAIGKWLEEQIEGSKLVTVAANVDSDKKPSSRTKDLGRGRTAEASAYIPRSVVEQTLKATPEDMSEVAVAKLRHGSNIAGSLGSNLQAANIIAALYLATGQDIAHTVEGSLTSTEAIPDDNGLLLKVRLPAVMVGVRGGGTTLPAQQACLEMILQQPTSLHSCDRLAQTVAAATLAGELSLLAAQASQHLAKSHQKMAR